MSSPSAIAPSAQAATALVRARARSSPGTWVWMVALVFAISFEGLGRKLFPSVPSIAFYFLKDVVLVLGALKFGVRSSVAVEAWRYFGRFRVLLLVAAVWTVVQVLNPDQASLTLGLVGLRSYWLWWLAPLVIASAVRTEEQFADCLKVLIVVALVVALEAAHQFVSPAMSSVNHYATYDGKEVMSTAIVGETGRARVSSTFAFLQGFVDFGTIVPTLLLTGSLTFAKGKLRAIGIAVAVACLATLPMSGSRSSVVLGAEGLGVVLLSVGIVRSTAGRTLVAAAVIAAVLSVTAFPEAFSGVQARFGGGDTTSRFEEGLNQVPGVMLFTEDYPALGIGTGMQQNARFALGANTTWNSEGELGRYLIELGPIGYILVYLVRVGLFLALWRLGRHLKTRGLLPMTGLARAMALYSIQGNMVFDHVYQALMFLAIGLLLAAAVMTSPRIAAAPRPRLAT